MDAPPSAFTKEELMANHAASRLECRLSLEAALEARFPRTLWKKPIFNSCPMASLRADMYMLHQVILRYGGYRRVDTANLWERVAETMGFAPPETTVAGKGSSMSSVKYQLREKAFRYLAWIENDAPPERVFGLQSASRIAALPLDPRSPAVLAVPGLAGGTYADAAIPYICDQDKFTWADDIATTESGQKRGRDEVGSAEGGAGEDSAAKRRRTGEEEVAFVESATTTVTTTAAKSTLSPKLPPYARRIGVQESWEQDAERLYRIHDNLAQLAGAVCAHMNPYTMSDDEESAFPAYSKQAHIATNYPDIHRREVVRTTLQVFVIPLLSAERRTVIAAYDDMRYEGDSDLNIQELANSVVYTPVGAHPKLAPVPRTLYHMPELLAALNITESMQMTAELKKRFSRCDPLTLRLVEGVHEQEPWIGTTMHRSLFYLELRNHILLKWIRSQDPTNPRNFVASRSGDNEVAETVESFGLPYNPASHPAWVKGANFIGPGATYAAIPPVANAAQLLPLRLTLKEALQGIPERFHEAMAAVFDYLESKGKINFGAIRLDPKSRMGESGHSPRANLLPLPADQRKRIIVVGAGISGLAAARQLLHFGHEVVILEGRSRPGGRICTNRHQLGIAIDEGAMITTGDEPNPCSLLVRQLNLRQHVIQNMQTPLLIPRKYFRCVFRMAKERAKFTAAIDAWRKRFQGIMEQLVATKPRKEQKSEASAVAVKPDEPKPEYHPNGRHIFGVFLPPALSHVSNEAVKHALRIASAHTTLVHSHLEFLKRLHKVLTAVIMAQLHAGLSGHKDPHDASYGVFNAESATLSASTSAQIDAILEEMTKASEFLAKSQADRAVELLYLALDEQSVERAAELKAPPEASVSSSATDGIDAADMKTAADLLQEETGLLTVLDDDVESMPEPFVVSIPTLLDLTIEREFNALMDAASALKIQLAGPALPDLKHASQLVRISRLGRETLQGCHPFAPMDNWVISGNEVISRFYTPEAASLHERALAASAFRSADGHGIPFLPTGGLPVVDPATYKFESGSEGTVTGVAITGVSLDILPRQRMPKYVDPRRSDDDVDGAYDHGMAVGMSLPAPQIIADRKRQGASAATRTNKKGSGAVGPDLTWPNHAVARTVNYGKPPAWDISIAEAIDYVATIDDKKQLDSGVLVSGGTVPEEGQVTKIESGVPRPPVTITYATPPVPPILAPPIDDRYVETDGKLGSGYKKGSSEHTDDVKEDELTYASLKRSVLRWHTANLEYGCARPMDDVSLQQWDQDDVFNYHDRGQHYFVKDGYDTHIRGLLPDVPVAYDTKVDRITYGDAAGGAVRVTCTASDGKSYDVEGDAVVVTCPVGVLQTGGLEFSPALPTWKQEAISAVGSGLLNKVILRFPTAFWRENSPAAADSSTASHSQGDQHTAVDNATSSLLATFGWGSESAVEQRHGHSAARARAGISKAALSFPSVQIVPAVELPDDTVAMPQWVSHLTSIGYIEAKATEHARVLAKVTTASVASSDAQDSNYVPLGHALGREPQRPCSFVPFMDILRHFHIQPGQLADSQLAAACSLALAYAKDVSASKSAFFNVKECIFKALHAILEAKGDMKSAAAMLKKWLKAWGTIHAKFQNLSERKLIEQLVAWERKSLIEETPPSLAGLYDAAQEYAASVFPLPKVPQSPFSSADGKIVEQEVPSALPATVEVLPAPVVQLSPTEATIVRSLLPQVFVTSHLNVFLQKGKELLAPLPAHKIPITFPTLGPMEDSFGRVVLGESPEVIKRRGEAYMFWCMDRYGLDATVVPGDQASPDSNTSPVLIAMMAGDAAEWVEKSSDKTVLSRVVGALKSLFGEGIPEPSAHVITRWRSEEFSRGTYSFLKPGSHGIHYDMMAQPVQDVVCFAGEATNRHHPTTAAGAFDSGIREAVRLGSRFGRSRDPDVVRLLQRRAKRLAQALPPSLGL